MKTLKRLSEALEGILRELQDGLQLRGSSERFDIIEVRLTELVADLREVEGRVSVELARAEQERKSARNAEERTRHLSKSASERAALAADGDPASLFEFPEGFTPELSLGDAEASGDEEVQPVHEDVDPTRGMNPTEKALYIRSLM